MKTILLSNFLLSYSQALVLALVLMGGEFLIFFLPGYLFWWVVILTLLILGGSFWLHRKLDQRTFLNWGELAVALLASLGVLNFTLLSPLQAFLVVGLSGLVYFFICHFHFSLRKGWPSFFQELALLRLLRVFIFFLGIVALLKITSFYNLGLAFLFVSFGLLVSFYLWFHLFSEQLNVWRKALYVILFLIIGEQLLWILYAWQRGVYFLAFILTVVYYIYLEYLQAYLKGRLTAQVVMEYFLLGGILILLLSLLDWFKGLG